MALWVKIKRKSSMSFFPKTLRLPDIPNFVFHAFVTILLSDLRFKGAKSFIEKNFHIFCASIWRGLVNTQKMWKLFNSTHSTDRTIGTIGALDSSNL